LILRLAALRPVKLEPLSRRRPLSSTGTGVIENDCVALIAFRFTPARLTQSSTSFEVEDRQAANAYFFFFLRLVFFFAAAFFRFLAMLPSSSSEWRSPKSVHGDREHCIPITRASEKLKQNRTIERQRGLSATRCCAHARAHERQIKSSARIVADVSRAFHRQCRTAEKIRLSHTSIIVAIAITITRA
jgi:hypothetical protein